jgi:hypothetical protein
LAIEPRIEIWQILFFFLIKCIWWNPNWRRASAGRSPVNKTSKKSTPLSSAICWSDRRCRGGSWRSRLSFWICGFVIERFCNSSFISSGVKDSLLGVGSTTSGGVGVADGGGAEAGRSCTPICTSSKGCTRPGCCRAYHSCYFQSSTVCLLRASFLQPYCWGYWPIQCFFLLHSLQQLLPCSPVSPLLCDLYVSLVFSLSMSRVLMFDLL